MSYASSSKTLLQSYDVFISFRGEDTRTGFTSHLYEALTRSDIRTYKDDRSLEIGSFIAPKLLQVIETSRFAIIVISRNFATSKWCLDEITKVVDCLEEGGNKLIVIPVFYHVSPSDVRHQNNCFKQGFANHERNPEITPQKVEIWRAAFAKVGDIAGLHVTQHSNEAEVISEITRRISKDQPQDTLPLDLANGLVGIESRADEVKRILRTDSSEVLFIGICGMSGIGKTTLAEAVYKDLQKSFESSSFIENIKDISKQNGSIDLRSLQQKLLDDILKEKSVFVQSVIHGQTLLGTKLRRFKVIIVLDDVNHADQLTYLAGGREWFGPGSRIIITTTNACLLNPHYINDIHRCEEMEDDEAIKLFCQSAFKKCHPDYGYEKLSNDIVKLAGGLPLALNVYGSLLCGKEENYWKDMLQKLGEYPSEEVLGRLEVVYARLERFQQKTFIYIACFLKGRSIDLVQDILKNIGLYPECGIPDLINKSLITVNDEDNVWMHDLLQQMCWEILRKESHSYRIAIRHRQHILEFLSSKSKETQTVEIINQEPYKIDVDDRFIDPASFSMLAKLKFLRISNLHFRQGLGNLSNDLRILEWYRCSLKSFPSTFEPTNIYEFEMCFSKLKTLWTKDLDLPKLRSINLSFSKKLSKLPDLRSIPNLVKLNLEGCTKVKELHESILVQKKLRYMNLKGCRRLQSLGRSIMEMDALEALLLSGCSNLEYIPEFGDNMKRLEHLYVDGTSSKKLPKTLGNLYNLRNLDASGTRIEELPSSIHCLQKIRLLHVNGCRLSLKTGSFLYTNLDNLSSCLRELDLSYCNLSVVPHGIGLLYHLVTLNLSGNDFVSLPASISRLSKLRILCLNNCMRLCSLPKLSLVDDDTDYGPRRRFSYYVSSEWVDVARFHASSSNSFPTVSCLNCPKLSENQCGSYLAEKVLNSYLQLRTNYWITPEAVFEIVGAGSEIPPGFVEQSSDDLILQVPWIGVAICAVIAVHHVDAYMEAKYAVTAHIHVGGKHWNISIPVNFLVTGLENQLVFYWTETDNLQRIVGSRRKNNFRVSFSVEPDDGNLQVTKYGVCFISTEYIMRLKQLEEDNSVTKMMIEYGYIRHLKQLEEDKSVTNKTMIEYTNEQIRDSEFLYTNGAWYTAACEVDKNLLSSNWNTLNMANFIFDYGERGSLIGIQHVIKALLEINQEFFEVLSVCNREWKSKLSVYCYYEISLGASVLYKDFVKSLKNINADWLSVKWALDKIVIKSRACDYTFEEMLQQLNDLEAAQNVGFSDNFITMFISIYKRAHPTIDNFDIDFQGKLTYKQIVNRFALEQAKVLGKKKFKQGKVLAKLSSVTIAGVFSMMAAFMCDYNLLKEMKDMTSNSIWLHVIRSFAEKRLEWFDASGRHMKSQRNLGLRVSDFSENANLVQELTNKMAWSGCFTQENEEMMMIVIDKLQKNIDKVSRIIEEMSSHAGKYSHDIREARKHVKSYSRFSKEHDSVTSKLSLFD